MKYLKLLAGVLSLTSVSALARRDIVSGSNAVVKAQGNIRQLVDSFSTSTLNDPNSPCPDATKKLLNGIHSQIKNGMAASDNALAQVGQVGQVDQQSVDTIVRPFLQAVVKAAEVVASVWANQPIADSSLVGEFHQLGQELQQVSDYAKQKGLTGLGVSLEHMSKRIDGLGPRNARRDEGIDGDTAGVSSAIGDSSDGGNSEDGGGDEGFDIDDNSAALFTSTGAINTDAPDASGTPPSSENLATYLSRMESQLTENSRRLVGLNMDIQRSDVIDDNVQMAFLGCIGDIICVLEDLCGGGASAAARRRQGWAAHAGNAVVRVLVSPIMSMAVTTLDDVNENLAEMKPNGKTVPSIHMLASTVSQLAGTSDSLNLKGISQQLTERATQLAQWTTSNQPGDVQVGDNNGRLDQSYIESVQPEYTQDESQQGYQDGTVQFPNQDSQVQTEPDQKQQSYTINDDSQAWQT